MNFLKKLSVIPSRSTIQLCFKRNLGASYVLYANTAVSDPIQKLFLDKLKEYGTKSEKQKSAFVDATPQTKKEFDDAMNKLKVQYGADKDDFTQFPAFSFTEPKLDPINLEEKH